LPLLIGGFARFKDGAALLASHFSSPYGLQEWRRSDGGRRSIRSQLTVETIMRKNLASIFIALLLLSGGGLILSACNTTEGAGEDISELGNAIDEAAEDAQE
jgi:predicted small secreted protein